MVGRFLVKKILYDRLPHIFKLITKDACSEEDWNLMSAEMHKRLLLEAHDSLLSNNSVLVKLLTEMEKE